MGLLVTQFSLLLLMLHTVSLQDADHVTMHEKSCGNHTDMIPVDVVKNVLLGEKRSGVKVWLPPKAKQLNGKSAFWQRWQCRWLSENMPGCKGRQVDIHADMGVIASPGFSQHCTYPADADCKWFIQARTDMIIRVQFLHFNVSHTEDRCDGDVLRIYDGTGSDALSLGALCGTYPPDGVITTSNSLYLNFRSNQAQNTDGFKLIFWQEPKLKVNPERCPKGVVDLAADNGTFSSPGYSSYSSPASCVWRITAPRDKVVVLVIEDYQLESEPDCLTDRLMIHDGRSFFSPVLASLCGTGNNHQVSSKSQFMLVAFITDEEGTNAGFRAKYYFTDGALIGTVPPTVTTEQECPADDLILTGVKGEVTSPGFLQGSQYPAELNCKWLIRIPQMMALNIYFTTFNTTEQRDVLHVEEVVYGQKRIMGQLSGLHTGLNMTASGTQLNLRFITQATGPPGFIIKWKIIAVTSDPSCSSNITYVTESTGYITSPNYGPLMEYPVSTQCQWVIVTPPGVYVKIFVRDTNTEQTYDYVAIYDGPDKKYKRLVQLSGTRRSREVTGTFPSVAIFFESDYDTVDLGFFLTYHFEVPPKGSCIQNSLVTLTEPQGSVLSPALYSYSTYPSFSNCKWKIIVEPGKAINLTFSLFRLTVYECPDDFIRVLDGPEHGGQELARFCSAQPDFDIKSRGNTMIVTFVSDRAQAGIGFAANYTTVPADADAVCSENVQTLGPENGVIHSPWRSIGRYPNGALCRWKIVVKEDQEIAIEFTEFKLESCWTDGVLIYDGPDETAQLLESYCGTFAPRTIRSTGNTMFVVFTSDSTIRGVGFSAKYWSENINPEIRDTVMACSDAPPLLTAPSGTIKSPYYGPESHYANNVTCRYHIRVPQNDVIHIKFLVFDVEYHRNCNFDHVKITDGDQVRKFCGSRPPPDFVTGSNIIELEFKTDTTMTYPGFEISYQAVSADMPNKNASSPNQKEGTDRGNVPVNEQGSEHPLCGLKLNDGLFNIIGGRVSQQNSWPWHGAVYVEGQFACGATILNDKWAIAAAHCIHDRTYDSYFDTDEVMLIFGTNTAGPQINKDNGIRVPIKRYIIHPDRIEGHRRRHDLSLLEFNSTLQLNETIRPACLTSHPPKQGTKCWAVGWGTPKRGGSLSVELKEVSITIADRGECKQKHGSRLLSGMACSGLRPRRKGTCEGDSGGGLVCEENGRYLIQAVTSWGYCEGRNAPHVFADLNYYQDFIHQHTGL